MFTQIYYAKEDPSWLAVCEISNTITDALSWSKGCIVQLVKKVDPNSASIIENIFQF